MQKEIEAKFLSQDHDKIRSLLKKAGATCKFSMKLMRRTVFDFPDRRPNVVRADNLGIFRG